MATAARKVEALTSNEADGAADPIVIVGNGPVGMRMAKELMQRAPRRPVVIYGEEPYAPYNRVRLSSWLAGEVDWEDLAQPLDPPPGAAFEERIGYRIAQIERDEHCVIDAQGRRQRYHKLILATGSTPFVPSIPGIDLQGIFTFRDLADTNRLLARRARSHHTVVIGGGLLGLEAARGMQRGNTRVTVVEHADRLLGRQLDEAASQWLQCDVESLGIEIIIGDGIAEIIGRERIDRVRLRSGRQLVCDTLIVAAGIRANIALAQSARLAFGRGVKVDDRMRTSDPDIYAIGECAEHRGQLYGLVAPGLEQAAVAAADIAEIDSHYAGSVAASRLKVVGTQVFSMGPMGAGEDPTYGRGHVYRDDAAGVYRKILVHRHRLVGAIGIGDWHETVRLQTMIGRAQHIWPWQVARFRVSGRIWPESISQGVAAWPSAAVVCQCTGVTRGAIGEAIALGACDATAISKATGASTVCGSCKPLVADLLGNDQAADPVPWHRLMLATAFASMLAVLAIMFGPAIPYADSVQHAWHWDVLWRDGLIKQITGFSVLGLFVAGLLVSLRKRTRVLDRAGHFDAWRVAHVLLGLLVVAGLVAHTGLRTGDGLNLLLMTTFGLLVLIGGISSVVIALEHRLDGGLAQRLRRQWVWLHILLFWPVPVLLGWHVFKTYWF